MALCFKRVPHYQADAELDDNSLVGVRAEMAKTKWDEKTLNDALKIMANVGTKFSNNMTIMFLFSEISSSDVDHTTTYPKLGEKKNGSLVGKYQI